VIGERAKPVADFRNLKTCSSRQTQRVLQPLFERPALKDKLLQRPPFRFLHDVVTAVTERTGFAQGKAPPRLARTSVRVIESRAAAGWLDTGLFDDNELLKDPRAIQERDDKVEYIDRVIRYVQILDGRELEAKAAKVVAGLEVEQTNRWLQRLAAVASSVACVTPSSLGAQ
jgi:TRAF3-interacting protein 1